MNHKPEGLPGLLFFTPKDYERLIRSQNEEKKAEYKAYLQLHKEAMEKLLGQRDKGEEEAR